MGKTFVAIVIAVIGAAATISAAYIQSHPSQGVDPASSKQVAVRSKPDVPKRFSTPSSRRTELDVTGVQIGSTNGGLFVVEKRTVFDLNEEVAVTVNYRGFDGISNFPVRLTVVFGSVMFGGDLEEETADVSTPGDSLWTFRFPYKKERAPGQYLLRVQVDGGDVYSQMVDFK